MQRVMVNVQTTDGRPVTVPGYRVSGVPGLAVHRELLRVRDGVPDTGQAWVITHERSGKGLSSSARFRTRGDAVRTARGLDLYRWDVEDPVSLLGVPDREHVVAVLMAGATDGGTRSPRRPAARVPAGVGGDGMREAAESFLPDGWELYDGDPFGDLLCPCGFRIEPDGVCPEGCASPLPI